MSFELRCHAKVFRSTATRYSSLKWAVVALGYGTSYLCRHQMWYVGNILEESWYQFLHGGTESSNVSQLIWTLVCYEVTLNQIFGRWAAWCGLGRTSFTRKNILRQGSYLLVFVSICSIPDHYLCGVLKIRARTIILNLVVREIRLISSISVPLQSRNGVGARYIRCQLLYQLLVSVL